MESITPTDALNLLHPLSCVLVISNGKDDKPNGMTASWFFQTSFDPPKIAVSIGKARYSYNLIKESKEFVIAIPNKDLERVVLAFGNTTGKEVDKFKETGVKTSKAQYVNVPLIADATINHECKLAEVIDTGDHSIFVGDVVASWINKDKKVLMNMGKPGGKRLFEEFDY